MVSSYNLRGESVSIMPGSSALSSDIVDASLSDTVDMGLPGAVYVGTGGALKVLPASSDVAVTFVNVPSGSFLPIFVKRIYVTGTTAEDILVLR